MRAVGQIAAALLALTGAARAEPPGEPPAGGARPAAPSVGVRVIDERHVEVDRRVLAGWLADRGALLTTARLVPASEGGKPVGFKVYAIRPASPLARLSLQNGDTVVAIAGVRLASISLDQLVGRPLALPAAARIAVELRRAGRPLTLELRLASPEEAAAWPSPPVEPTGPPVDVSVEDPELERLLAVGVRAVDASHYQISTAVLERILANPMAVARGGRVVPSIKDGKPNGFKLFAIRPGSFFARLGLRNGDIVSALDGHPLTSPDRALEAYTRMRDATSFSIAVLRDGKSSTLHYSIQ